ncbi:MAG: Rrf2 family transcriptional regulator [Cloacibacillus sp.]
MAITQKCQYALRAIFELAKRQSDGPCKIGAVAEAQGIPVRFLENILSSLKSAGFVDSARGKDGGYFLAKPADAITVGEVIRFVQGPLGPVECTTRDEDDCSFYDDCVFRPLWEKARVALESVYDGTTFRDLVNQSENNCCRPECRCGKKYKNN